MSHRKESGFTLVELMIVVAIIGIIAGTAIPSLLRSRIAANESSAVGTLRSIVTVQSTWAQNDTDRNRINDYWVADASGLYRIERMPAGSGVAIAVMDVAVAMSDDAKEQAFGVAGAALPGTLVSAAGLTPLTRTAGKAGYLVRAIAWGRFPFLAPYRQDPDRNGQRWSNTGRFAFQARPERYDATGLNMFIVNESGVIYGRDFGNNGWWNAMLWPGPNPTTLAWRVVQ